MSKRARARKKKRQNYQENQLQRSLLKRSKLRSKLVIFTFATLFFASLTLLQIILACRDFSDWNQLREDGVVVKAFITKLELVSPGGSRGYGAVICVVRYRYSINGQSYIGNRYGINDTGRREYNQLAPFKATGRPINCYVSASDPELSFIDKTVHTSTILVRTLFITAFSLCSIIILRTAKQHCKNFFYHDRSVVNNAL